MTIKLLRYNREPLKLDVNQISTISGISQSNTLVVMKTGETHQGSMVKFN